MVKIMDWVLFGVTVENEDKSMLFKEWSGEFN